LRRDKDSKYERRKEKSGMALNYNGVTKMSLHFWGLIEKKMG
jgi:hypothetical protein